MERQEEIKQILKHLLAETEEGVNKGQYTNDFNKIITSCKNVVKNTNIIEEYLEELKKLNYEK